MKARVLVTGGAGYVGSHTCKAIARAGGVPIVYDNLSEGHEWAVKWGPLEEGDILDAERLAEVIRTHKPDVVMHFAASAYVGESVEDPAKYYRNNVVGTLTLLDAMRTAGIDRFVFSSTCSVYGLPRTATLDETHGRAPISPYGMTKFTVERCLEDFGDAYGFKSVCLRYFNSAGADPEGEIGEAHEPETHLIPLVLEAAMGRRPTIAIFGTDHDTPDGTCIRDFIHVTDIADAHLAAASYLDAAQGFSAFNLGTGTGTSVRQVIAAAQRVCGRALTVVEGDPRAGDPARLVASNQKAGKALGWQPAHSDMDTILATAWEWMKKHP